MGEIFREFHRVRSIQRIVSSVPTDVVKVVPIVLFGAEGDLAFYVESMYGVPGANAYFNSRSLEFLTKLIEVTPDLAPPHTRSGPISPQHIELLKIEPMLEKQIDDCPESLREVFCAQILDNIRDRLKAGDTAGRG